MKKILKRLFPGVSWQNPIVNTIIRCIDPIDYVSRFFNGLKLLPLYSVRVRSNGVTKQFGGKNFVKFGNLLVGILKEHAFIISDSKVLEIGCGCGRTAYGLTDFISDGCFTGIDIEKTSLDACRKTPLFVKKKFNFDFLDIKNEEYNPDGVHCASTYSFPYKDESFNVIYLVSVLLTC